MKTNTFRFLLLLQVVAFSLQAQSLKVEQTKSNEFHIQVDDPKSKLSWNAFPDNWKVAKPLTLKSADETVVLASVHPIIKSESNKKVVFEAPRGIKLQGAINFRDMGGYKTTDGKQVKWGKIYRSADVSKLTDADLELLSQLNIKMVCDLRGEKEAELAPDKIIPGSERILLPAGSENVGSANSYMKYMTTQQRADSMMRSFYTRTDHLKAKYKPMFDQLLVLETDKALMFHCTAGKDRTGVGAALILFALGVDENTILKDYELTNEYRKEGNEQYVKMLTTQGLPEGAARSMMAANPMYLKTTFESIATKFGSVDKFLENELDLTPSKKAQLRSKFLY
ncbi:MAG: tyrosine-protein phosphatase [Cyclobacteriaceae bacterium]